MVLSIMVLPNNVWFHTSESHDECLELTAKERIVLNEWLINHSKPFGKNHPRWSVVPLFSGLSGFHASKIGPPPTPRGNHLDV